MMPTKGRVFVDSNVMLYLLSDDERKKNLAKEILKANPSINTQVVSENVNVLLRKFQQLTLNDVAEHVKMLSNYCSVNPVNISTLEKALELKARYKFQWFDSTILAAAILAECSVIYSEDMQHGQLIENTLTIVIPFL